MRFASSFAFASTLVAPILAQDSVYAVYIFHRHGDRTPKSLPPTKLTSLGYEQVITAGTYYHGRYVDNTSSTHIVGLGDIVSNSQIAVSAPLDTVLLTSAQGFLQGLYPPTSRTEALANGTTINAPMNGYQLIPVTLVNSGTGSEDNAWLQDASGCANAQVSSNNYFSSSEYNSLLNSTKDYYTRLAPVTNATFASSYMTYKNGYTIFDLINVARIHNKTIPSGDLLDPATVLELQVLANIHEFGLAYNASDNARAVPGMQLAGEIMTFLNNSITSKGKTKIGIQFGAYASFLSFFGLTDLPKASVNFTGIPDYASSMVFEVYGPAGNATAYPGANDLNVRFFYSNGSTGILGAPTPYPLFGGSDLSVSWNDFATKMSAFEISTSEKWCTVCGNTTGVCAGVSNSSSGGSSSGSSGSKHGGMSLAVAGVIGAMVTLAVVLGVEALIALVLGLRLYKKGARNGASSPMSEGVKAKC